MEQTEQILNSNQKICNDAIIRQNLLNNIQQITSNVDIHFQVVSITARPSIKIAMPSATTYLKTSVVPAGLVTHLTVQQVFA